MYLEEPKVSSSKIWNKANFQGSQVTHVGKSAMSEKVGNS